MSNYARLLLLWILLHTPCLATGRPPTVKRTSPVTVVVFLDTECPICQQYTRPLKELYQQYAPKGVRFIGVFPSSTDNKASISVFRKTYSLNFPGQADPSLTQVRLYKARVMPEVVVVNEQGSRVYQGAVDDWFVALGRYRREPTQHYLRDALDAVLAGRLVPIAQTQPIGCRIQL